MNTAERTQTRQSIIDEGFRRTDCTQDLTGTGAYTETWAHADGTTLTIAWAPRTVAEFTPGLYCPHCGHATITGTPGERSCVDCYWQEGTDPEHPTPLSAPKGAN